MSEVMSLKDLIKNQTGKTVIASGSTPRDKVLLQAHSMLTKLDSLRSADELDYEGSKPLWWGGKAIAGKRKVAAFYSNKKFDGTECEVDNNVKAIEEHIVALAEVFAKADDSIFEAEEKRRTEAAEKNAVKKS